MININSENISTELKDVLRYMSETLVLEFPTEIFAPEHLMLAILDCPNSYASILLEKNIMSNNLKELNKIFSDYLKNKSNECKTLKKTKNNIECDNDLRVIMEMAEIECSSFEQEHRYKSLKKRYVTSEDVLLSMINPKNNFKKFQDVFKAMGIDYSFLRQRCMNSDDKMLNKKNYKKIGLPLKSEINPIGVTEDNKGDYIKKYTRNITLLANEGKLDTLIGREKEIKQIISTFARRKKNNVIIVGSGGVGKTACVYGLADKIIKKDVPDFLDGKEIVELDVMSLVSGTHFRGMFEERVNGLFKELKNNKKYILFIDDVQNVLKNSSKDKDTDLSGMLNEILSENTVQVICTATFKDYRNSVENNSSLSRKFQKIIIEPNTITECVEILMQNKKYYEEYHKVTFSEKCIQKCVELANRYVSDRCLPDSAFDLLDTIGASCCFSDDTPDDVKFAKKRLVEIKKDRGDALNQGLFEMVDMYTQEEQTLSRLIAEYKRNNSTQNGKIITDNDVYSIVSQITNIPISKLSNNEKSKVANIENTLKESVVGQDDAVKSICRIIKRNKVGLGDKNRTLGVLLLAGQTGTGKSLIAKKLAEEIFGDEKALIRIDMSEYSEKNSVSKLTGSAPGFIGYNEGGQLTEAVKNKQHCVLLLDEIEKADKEVYNVFLQVFDEGRLTDSSGQLVNFKNTIILLTSNIGAKKASDFSQGIGFVNDVEQNKKSIYEKEIKNKFTPEFLNRIDEIVYFNPLNDENLYTIVNLELKKLNKRINEINYNIKWDDNVLKFLTDLAIKEREFGARPILRLIQFNIEDKITELLLQNEYEDNYTFSIKIENNEIKIS